MRSNGITMRIAEQGSGPLVLPPHGFPEGWCSWRHQPSALAAAGYRVVAPDRRGYGGTEKPDAIDACVILTLTADVVGLVTALGEPQAVVVGLDSGAPVASHSGLLRPDVFRAVGLLSVPCLPRAWGEPRPTDLMRAMVPPGMVFHQYHFQEPGKAEAELEADVRRALTMSLCAASGDAPSEKRWRYVFAEGERLLDTGGLPDTLPDRKT